MEILQLIFKDFIWVNKNRWEVLLPADEIGAETDFLFIDLLVVLIVSMEGG